MADDLNYKVGMFSKRCSSIGQNLLGASQQTVGIADEINAGQFDDVLELTTVDINTHACGGIWALVQAINYGIAIAIEFATTCIYFDLRNRIGAAVKTVGDAIAIIIDTTTKFIDRDTLR